MKSKTFSNIREIKRGQIYMVYFDPTVGHEIKKTRPAVVIQNDLGNRFSSTTIVAAVTGNGKKFKKAPVCVLIAKDTTKLKKESIILLNQIRTIDKQRLTHFIDILPELTMKELNIQLKISLDLE